jgi:hypothetical protein
VSERASGIGNVLRGARINARSGGFTTPKKFCGGWRFAGAMTAHLGAKRTNRYRPIRLGGHPATTARRLTAASRAEFSPLF